MNSETHDVDLSTINSSTIVTDRDEKTAFYLLHRLLRGRCRYALPLAAILGVAGALVGTQLSTPRYTSIGRVRVQPTLPRIIYTIEENRVPAMFDSVVQAEATNLQDQRVIEAAAASDVMRNAAWPRGDQGTRTLARALRVDRARGSQNILVKVTLEDPQLARVAVNAVLDAYEELYGGQIGITINDRERELRDRRKDLEFELAGTRTRVRALAEKYGSDDLDLLHRMKLEEYRELAMRVAEIESLLASREVESSTTVAPGEDNTLAPDEDNAQGSDPAGTDFNQPELLAAIDKDLAALLGQKRALESELMTSRDKYGESHRIINRLEKQLEVVSERIVKRLEDLRLLLDAGVVAPPSPIGSIQPGALGAATTMSSEDLEARRAEFGRQRDAAFEELKLLIRDKLRMLSQQEMVQSTKAFISETTLALEQLDVESPILLGRGRISIMRGQIPLEPSSDKRLQLAVLGGGGGVMAGIGLVCLVGLLKPTYRYIDELEHADSSIHVVGTLPDMAEASPERRAHASMSIHHLRNLLQLQYGTANGKGSAYVITSARPGDGKTSLALALATSFAVEGLRTIVLDVDLVGRGLSRTLDFQDAQGLAQALTRERVSTEVHATDIPNLWIMPAGPAETCKPESMSEAQFRRVLDQLRSDFAAIIVDTGPLLGSLEANLAVALSDLVILTVPRGQDSRLVRLALDRFGRLGARCAGFVFNRASDADLRRSSSQISFPSRPARTRDDTEAMRNGTAGPGALARALLDSPSDTSSKQAS